MKKVIIFSLSSLFLLTVFLQTPFLLNQQAQAVDCTCNANGGKGGVAGVNGGDNGYTCTDGFKSSCSDSQSKNGGSDADACVPSTGATVYTAPALCTQHGAAGKGGEVCLKFAPAVTYTGVACTNNPSQGGAISCTCQGNKVMCSKTGGTPQLAQDCGDAKIKTCRTSNDIYTDWNGQPVRGAACVAQCTCDKSGDAAVGQGNNGWTCPGNGNDGSGACHNLEDKCVDSTIPIPGPDFEPSTGNGSDHGDWKSVSCVNATKCVCNPSKTAINCTAAGVVPSGTGVGPSGTNETFTVDCSSDNKQCTTGPGIDDPNFTAFNQHITNIACIPLPSLPPNPSPPCAVWSNGTCTSFDTGFGLLSTGTTGFVTSLFSIMLSISGGIALLLIIRAGYQLMTAQGKPEQLQQGRDQLIAAIVGLIFLIFSFVFLQLIGVDILHLPGFGGAGTGTGTTAPTCNLSQCVKSTTCAGLLNGTGKTCNPNGCPSGESCEQ